MEQILNLTQLLCQLIKNISQKQTQQQVLLLISQARDLLPTASLFYTVKRRWWLYIKKQAKLHAFCTYEVWLFTCGLHPGYMRLAWGAVNFAWEAHAISCENYRANLPVVSCEIACIPREFLPHNCRELAWNSQATSLLKRMWFLIQWQVNLPKTADNVACDFKWKCTK